MAIIDSKIIASKSVLTWCLQSLVFGARQEHNSSPWQPAPGRGIDKGWRKGKDKQKTGQQSLGQGRNMTHLVLIMRPTSFVLKITTKQSIIFNNQINALGSLGNYPPALPPKVQLVSVFCGLRLLLPCLLASSCFGICFLKLQKVCDFWMIIFPRPIPRRFPCQIPHLYVSTSLKQQLYNF